MGGGQIGYNWLFAGSFVAGVEADILGVAGSASRTDFAAGRRTGVVARDAYSALTVCFLPSWVLIVIILT